LRILIDSKHCSDASGLPNKKAMFGLFKKKSEKERLADEYKMLMEKAHKMSHSNRKAADKLMEEAENVAKKIDKLA